MGKSTKTSPTKIVNPKDKDQLKWMNSILKPYERLQIKSIFNKLKKQMFTQAADSIDDLCPQDRMDMIIERMEDKYPNYKLLKRGKAQQLSTIYLSVWTCVQKLCKEWFNTMKV